MSTALASVATSLETAAGATTSANPNTPGYWSRIAAASEVLADATTSANATTSGYMLRAALALESIAGTDGNEENASYAGYLKRIVDALEVQAGAVEVGSLEHRMVLAAAGAEFGPDFDPDQEYSPDPVFDNPAAWTTKVRCSVSGGTLIYDGQTNPICAGPPVIDFAPGTYRVTGVIDTLDAGTVTAYLAGGSMNTIATTTGAFSADIVVASVVSQLIRFGGTSNNNMTMSSNSVKRIA